MIVMNPITRTVKRQTEVYVVEYNGVLSIWLGTVKHSTPSSVGIETAVQAVVENFFGPSYTTVTDIKKIRTDTSNSWTYRVAFDQEREEYLL